MECVVCGQELTGRQQKYCSDKCRSAWKYSVHKQYYLDYQQTRRNKVKIVKYCMICGKILSGRQKKFCSIKCKKKNNTYNQYKVDSESKMPLPVPPKDNKCVECMGNIIFKDNEYFCGKCGLVVI